MGMQSLPTSQRWTLNSEDWKKWGINFVRFVLLPCIVAFFTALQGGVDIKIAQGVALGTLYTSILDLARKFYANG